MTTGISTSLSRALLLTRIAAVLAAIAAGGGLLIPGLYNETAWALPQMQGQDVVTVIVAVLMFGLSFQPSLRVQLIIVGLLGYIWYTYTGAAFAYTLNEFFLLYVALFSLSSIALISVTLSIDRSAIVAVMQKEVPVRSTRIALITLAVLLGILWFGQIGAYLVTGNPPEGVRLGGNGFIYPYVLDLGVILPLSLMAASWLKTRNAWGLVCAGALLIKAAAMGFALIAMSVVSLLAGLDAPIELFSVWIAIALGGSIMAYRFLRHVREAGAIEGATSPVASLDLR